MSNFYKAIGAAVLEVIAQLAYKESFVPRLLQNKKAKLVKSNPDRAWYTVLDLDLGEKDAQKTTTTAMIIESVSRPRKLSLGLFPLSNG